MPIAAATMSYQEIKNRLGFKLGFNEDYLDKELAESADIFQQICEQTALHGGRVAQIELEYTTLKAELKTKVRQDLINKGIKDTNDKTEEGMRSLPEYEIKKNELRQATIELEKWTGLKESWKMRQQNLDLTARAIFSGYINYQKKIGQV